MGVAKSPGEHGMPLTCPSQGYLLVVQALTGWQMNGVGKKRNTAALRFIIDKREGISKARDT